MSRPTSFAHQWKWFAFVAISMMVLSLLPQVHLWMVRGKEWKGAYVSPQADEFFYSGYINALIDGRTRKNDPFGGQDSSANAPLPESIFSIQFVPPYIVALPARAIGVSASTAFIVLLPVVALLASLSIFWLINSIVGDPRSAAAGSLFVLCFGCLVGWNGIFGTFLDIGPSVFPFLRRYQPAVAFPLFFAFQALVWRALFTERERTAEVASILAAITLVVLVFSHLYLWTAAAAWMACFAVLCLWFRRTEARKIWLMVSKVLALTAVSLGPYIYLLSQRAPTLDEQQILVLTHRPDLFRLHEILGAAIILALIIGVKNHRIQRTDPRLIYAASLGLLPFVVFNQQIVTGRSMQPFHFEVAVINYSTLVGLLVTFILFLEPVPRRVLLWIGSSALLLGVLMAGLPARLVFVPQAVANDRSIPVLLRLKELSKQDGTLEDLRSKGQSSTLVYSPSVALIALLPTWTAQGTLLDMTGVDCRGMSRAERKRLFLMHLYYSGTDAESFRRALKGDRSRIELASVQTVVFGYERTSPALVPSFEPITEDEVEREVRHYEAYTQHFSRAEALTRPIKYAIYPSDRVFDLGNLDRWYERYMVETVDSYTLYHLKLRD